MNRKGAHQLRSIYTNIDMTTDDNLIMFVGDIHCGSTHEEIESFIQSAGEVSNGYTLTFKMWDDWRFTV